MRLQAERGGSKRQHARQLTAAENADRRAGCQHGHASSKGRSATAAVWRARRGEPRGQGLVRQREHGRGEQRGIDGAGLADRERADGDTGRHLHDRKQAVLSGQGLGLDRDAKDRKLGEGSGHAGQMRRAAGAGDDNAEAGRLGALGKGIEAFRRAVGGDDPRVVGDTERVERLGGVAHGRPVGLAAHDDGHRRRHVAAPAGWRPRRSRQAESRSRSGGKRGDNGECALRQACPGFAASEDRMRGQAMMSGVSWSSNAAMRSRR